MEVAVKVCGLRRPEDAVEAFAQGAAYGGVIGHPASPRFVPEEMERDLLDRIPVGRRVWVAVEPHPDRVEAAFARGFDFAQIHFDPEGTYSPQLLAEGVDAERLWLAPRMANPLEFQPEWIELAGLFLIDGFARDRMGGTGQLVDGEAYAELQRKFPEAVFALAGGLDPQNIGAMLRASEATQIDVNSGVESAPGVKDPRLIRQLFERVREADPEE
tara:strand:+ start:11516 stop:12163 length:648 start_codon:yes stop_codon:yes gene_type:complete